MDRRVERTRRLLQEALLELARERDLDEISVADIADRATVNRSTFYQHYSDKETLLADALDTQAQLAGATFVGLDVDLGDAEPPDVLLRYARHLAENAPLYRRALNGGGSGSASARLRSRLRTMIGAAIETEGFDPEAAGMPAEILAASITGSVLEVLAAWLEMTPLPPAETAARWAWLTLVNPLSEKNGIQPHLPPTTHRSDLA